MTGGPVNSTCVPLPVVHGGSLLELNAYVRGRGYYGDSGA